MKAKYDTSKLISLEIVPGYRILETLESGLSGDIYSVTQIETGTPCRLIVRKADAETAEEFINEATTASRLFEAAIEDVYEFGALDDDRVFIVTENVAGRSLRAVLDTDGIPDLLVSVEIIRRAAEALHCLHAKGLTHKAIRPENIIVTDDENGEMLVRLQHLDLAGLGERSIVSNKFAIEAGLDSLRYFSPEQTSNENSGPGTDIYSLGIVFYEILTGFPPFDATKATTLIGKHRNATPPDVRIDNFDLRMLVTHALMESLQKRPEARQTSAGLLARQLRQIEQLATHVSTPPPILEMPLQAERPVPRKIIPQAEDYLVLNELSASLSTHEDTSFESGHLVSTTVPIEVTTRPRVEPMELKLGENKVPRKVHLVDLDDDLPTLDDVSICLKAEEEPADLVEPRSIEIAADKTDGDDWMTYEPIAGTYSSGQDFVTPLEEVEEDEVITIVTAPTRIKVDVAPVSSVPVYETFKSHKPDEVDFFPTLLGDVTRQVASEPVQDSFFSAYKVPQSKAISLQTRIGIASGGLVFLIAFFLFGNTSVRRFVENSSSDDSVVAASTSEGSQEPTKPVERLMPSLPLPKPASEKVMTPKVSVVENPGTDIVVTKAVRSSGRREPNAALPQPKQSTNAVTPTTLVISADKGKVKMKSEPTKSQAGATRPRVVKEP